MDTTFKPMAHHLSIQYFFCLLEPSESSSIARKPVGIECLVGSIGDCHHYLTAHWMSGDDVYYQRKGAAKTRRIINTVINMYCNSGIVTKCQYVY